MNIPWDDLRLFLAIAETGSLSAAARQLGVTQPTASRRLADVEALLGDVLFARSVDGAKLTSFGERLVEPAKRMAEWAGEVDRAAERRDTSPRGVVRITAPPGLAYDFLAPFAAWMQKKLPEVRLEVASTTQYLDLARREADLALRVQRPSPDLSCVASIAFGVGAFASRSYIQALPRGYGPADIAWIGWAPPFEHLSPNPELTRRIPGFRPSFASDDFVVQIRAAEEGAGAIFLGRVRHRFSRATTLEELDVDLGVKLTSSMHIVCAKSALDIPRVRAVADLLAGELKHATVDGPRPGRTTKKR
jgi:DNA-binding transcriptional LysR family regulator